jgi:hypothetical protein
MPIHAPEGAVPARAYEIPAPDLSRGSGHYSEEGSDNKSQTAGYIQGHDGRGSAAPVSHGNRFLSWTDNIRQRDMYKGSSEEVVSAVVLVKQK